MSKENAPYEKLAHMIANFDKLTPDEKRSAKKLRKKLSRHYKVKNKK